MPHPDEVATLFMRLRDGAASWNAWRKSNPDLPIDFTNAPIRSLKFDLSGYDLSHANLLLADLEGVCLENADLGSANLLTARLERANLRNANLAAATLSHARLARANLQHARLFGAFPEGADLTEADLSGADLTLATLVQASLFRAKLNGCRVYGTAAWDVLLDGADQTSLVITQKGEPEITVDNLRIAQFIYLLLHNEDIRDIIDTITSKVVLILGRFMPERKALLDAIREELRKRNFLPVLFDFACPGSRDSTETVSILAHMARFVIADITGAKSIPQELMRIVPALPSVPVQPLLLASEYEYGMFDHFKRFPWVLPTFRYNNLEHALESVSEGVIAPAEAKARYSA